MADLEDAVKNIASRSPRAGLRSRVPATAAPRARPNFLTRRPRSGGATSFKLEQWVGQRGLLAVGVTLLILGAGYFLKLAFDRGWISPLLRCAGGAVVGVSVGAVGWHFQARGLRRYGAGLLGCGAAIVYVAVWAAARQYDLISYNLGLAVLALVSVTLDAIAYRLDHEELGAGAAAGALFAPIVLGVERGQADALLVYLASIAGLLGWPSVRRHWRRAVGLIALSYFGLGVALGAEYARPAALVMFGLLGGGAGIYVGLRRGWSETRLLSFTGSWLLLVAASGRGAAGWLIAGAGITLALPVWWHAMESPTIWPDPRGAEEERWKIGDMVPFYLAPLLAGWAVHQLAPSWLGRHGGVVPLVIAIPYLYAGLVAVRPHFALVGTSAMGIAVLAEFDITLAAWALLGLALLWPALDHNFRRPAGRWYGTLALVGALYMVLLVALPERAVGTSAFVDAWALLLWGSIAVSATLAARLWLRAEVADAEPPRDLHRGKEREW